MGEPTHAWEQRIYGKTLYVLLNIATNLNLLKNSLLKNEHKALTICLTMRMAPCFSRTMWKRVHLELA